MGARAAVEKERERERERERKPTGATAFQFFLLEVVTIETKGGAEEEKKQ